MSGKRTRHLRGYRCDDGDIIRVNTQTRRFYWLAEALYNPVTRNALDTGRAGAHANNLRLLLNRQAEHKRVHRVMG